jgi:choline dehydrogenase-like flavoprotein
MLRDGAFGGHHIGTTRMSASPRRGVVDADCKVHGLANLHIASSAVFPTSSHANPTLTIVAMALRLAARLARPPVPHDCATGAGRAAEPAKPAEAVS